MATIIMFVCADCGEVFEEPVQAFIDVATEAVMAPALCKDCGHGDDD